MKKKLRQKIEQTVADVSTPANSFLQMALFVGVSGATVAAALFLLRKVRRK